MQLQIALWARLANRISRLFHPGKPQSPTRIFVCVKSRTDGRACCAAQGARELIDKLQAELAADPDLAKTVNVRPNGCLDHCEQGLVAIAYRGSVATWNKPPKKKLDRRLRPHFALFRSARPEDAAAMLDVDRPPENHS